jgi:putative hydrolase of the HAD superfamily
VTVTHVFFDIGGVLGTNGWDREQRAAAVRHFDLDAADLEDRHVESIAILEQGRMTLDEYLRCAVFYRPRPFTAEEFKAYMLAQSTPFPESIDVVRGLVGTGRYRLMTINNESAELNQYRVEQFGLRDLFIAFFSSCWVGILKPAQRIYQVALAMSQADPAQSVFIDDRERNLEPARNFGMQTVRFTDAATLRQDLAGLGVQ